MQPEHLITRLQQKDDRAFAKIYEMYADNVFGIIHTIIKDEEVSAEVMNDVFMKVWEKASTYSAEKGRFFTWLLNISRNAAIDKLRTKSFKHNQQNAELDKVAFFVEDDIKLDNVTDAIGIKKWLQQLKPMCIRLLDLLFFQGFTQKDAADELEIPLGTVKSRSRNCLQNLKDKIED